MSTAEKEQSFETWLRRRTRPQQVHHSFVERFTRSFFAGDLIIVRHSEANLVYIDSIPGKKIPD